MSLLNQYDWDINTPEIGNEEKLSLHEQAALLVPAVLSPDERVRRMCTPQQQACYDLAKTGQNVFLTGDAGVGKSFLLRLICDWFKEQKIPYAVTASTGIAATYINGVTFHSWTGMRIDIDTPEVSQDNHQRKRKQQTNFLLTERSTSTSKLTEGSTSKTTDDTSGSIHVQAQQPLTQGGRYEASSSHSSSLLQMSTGPVPKRFKTFSTTPVLLSSRDVNNGQLDRRVHSGVTTIEGQRWSSRGLGVKQSRPLASRPPLRSSHVTSRSSLDVAPPMMPRFLTNLPFARLYLPYYKAVEMTYYGIVNSVNSAAKWLRWNTTKMLVIDEISMLKPSLFLCFDLLARMLRSRRPPNDLLLHDLHQPTPVDDHGNPNPNPPVNPPHRDQNANPNPESLRLTADQIQAQREPNRELLFGGLQVIVVGDFAQLPPVFKNGEKLEFCFMLPLWKQAFENTTVYLSKSFRQQNDEFFVHLLNRVRLNQLLPSDVKYLNSLVVPTRDRQSQRNAGRQGQVCSTSLDSKLDVKQEIEIAQKLRKKLFLFSRRVDVDTFNRNRLLPLLAQFPKHTFYSSSSSIDKTEHKEYSDVIRAFLSNMRQNGQAPVALDLCKGCKVMLVANLSSPDLVNGLCGIVVGFTNTNKSNNSNHPHANAHYSRHYSRLTLMGYNGSIYDDPDEHSNHGGDRQQTGPPHSHRNSLFIDTYSSHSRNHGINTYSSNTNNGGVISPRDEDWAYSRAASSDSSSWRGPANAHYRQVKLTGQESWPIVYFPSLGRKEIILPHVWKWESNDSASARWFQVPLRHAWALTVQKAQGASCPAIHIHTQNFFSHGQFYTALSRAQTLEHVTLSGFHPRMISLDRSVQQFYALTRPFLGKTLSPYLNIPYHIPLVLINIIVDYLCI